jgi:hypothetical protein
MQRTGHCRARLAHRLSRQRPSFVGEHGDLVSGNRRTHRCGSEPLPAGVDARQTRFDESVRLADRHAVPIRTTSPVDWRAVEGEAQVVSGVRDGRFAIRSK